jgi:hypothetical protein
VTRFVQVHIIQLLVAFVLTFACDVLFAQDMYKTIRTTYISATIGPSKYLGDIGSQNDNAWNQYQINQGTWFGGASLQRQYGFYAAIEAQLNVGKLASADRDVKYTSINDPNYLLYARNLDFKTNITEFSLLGHFMPANLIAPNSWLGAAPIQFFTTAGLGYFSFNPQGSLYDESFQQTFWYDLRPLNTEGQGWAEYPHKKVYNLRQGNLAYGFGLMYKTSGFYYCSIGVLGRKLFTDYLDDVSGFYPDANLFNRYITQEEEVLIAQQLSNKSLLVNPFSPNTAGDIRGNPNKNDAYYNFYAKVGFRIGAKKSKVPQYYKYGIDEICE